MAVFRDTKSGKYRYICDVCPTRGHRQPDRGTANTAEKRHLIQHHGGAEVFDQKPPPPTPDEDGYSDWREEVLGAYFGAIFAGSIVEAS